MPMLITPHYLQLFASPVVAASLNRDLSRIQEGCSHWYMILNTNKTTALVVSRSRTVNPPHGDFVLFGVSICASHNLDILGVKFDSRLTFEDHVSDIVSRVAQRICILRLVKRVFVDTSVVSYKVYRLRRSRCKLKQIKRWLIMTSLRKQRHVKY